MKPKPDSSSKLGVRGCGQRGSASAISIRSPVGPARRSSPITPLSRACRTTFVTNSDTSRTAVCSR